MLIIKHSFIKIKQNVKHNNPILKAESLSGNAHTYIEILVRNNNFTKKLILHIVGKKRDTAQQNQRRTVPLILI